MLIECKIELHVQYEQTELPTIRAVTNQVDSTFLKAEKIQLMSPHNIARKVSMSPNLAKLSSSHLQLKMENRLKLPQ